MSDKPTTEELKQYIKDCEIGIEHTTNKHITVGKQIIPSGHDGGFINWSDKFMKQILEELIEFREDAENKLNKNKD